MIDPNTYRCPQCGHVDDIDMDDRPSADDHDGRVHAIYCSKCECEFNIVARVEWRYEQDEEDFARTYLRTRGYMGPYKQGLDIYLSRFLRGDREKCQSLYWMDEAHEVVARHFDMPIQPPWQCNRCQKKFYPWVPARGLPDYKVCEQCEDALAQRAKDKHGGGEANGLE